VKFGSAFAVNFVPSGCLPVLEEKFVVTYMAYVVRYSATLRYSSTNQRQQLIFNYAASHENCAGRGSL